MPDPESSSSSPAPLPESAFLVEPSRRRRRRRRLLIGIAAGACLALPVACCGLLSLFVKGERKTQPAEVLAMARTITPLELPEGYAGELAETVQTPMFTVRKTMFRHTSGKGTIWLNAVKFHLQDADKDPATVQRVLQQLTAEMRQMIPGEETKRTVPIHGANVEFTIRSGADTQSSTQLHEVRGTFSVGDAGMIELWWQAEDSVWDAADVEAFLRSLQSSQD